MASTGKTSIDLVGTSALEILDAGQGTKRRCEERPAGEAQDRGPSDVAEGSYRR